MRSEFTSMRLVRGSSRCRHRPLRPGPRRQLLTPPTTRTSSSSVPARPAAPPPYWLASAGLDVAVLEKTTFPREKVCGDGLTPRGTRALIDMGIDVSQAAGWVHNRGLRVIGGGLRLHLDWPELTSFPSYGLVRPRSDLDALLANRAVSAGAVLHEQTTVTEPVLDRAGRVAGVPAKTGADKTPVTYRAPIVLSCDGVSGKLAQQLGLHRNGRRPMGVAVRRYYASPRTHDDYLESWLELWDGPMGADDAKLLPGYGWIFGMGDGTVNVGLGVLNSSASFQTDRLSSDAYPLARRRRRRPGGCARSTPPARFGVPVCPWGSTGRRITPAVCSWSGTPAVRSTRSTARASRTRWSPGSSRPRPCVQALARPSGPATGARARFLSGGDGGRLGRLLPLGRRVREAHRPARGHALPPATVCRIRLSCAFCSNCSPTSTTPATVTIRPAISVLTRLIPAVR